MDGRKLKSILILNGESQKDLANVLELSPTTVSYKINESKGREFTQSEIRKIKEHYDLSAEDINEIFFNHFVS